MSPNSWNEPAAVSGSLVAAPSRRAFAPVRPQRDANFCVSIVVDPETFDADAYGAFLSGVVLRPADSAGWAGGRQIACELFGKPAFLSYSPAVPGRREFAEVLVRAPRAALDGVGFPAGLTWLSSVAQKAFSEIPGSRLALGNKEGGSDWRGKLCNLDSFTAESLVRFPISFIRLPSGKARPVLNYSPLDIFLDAPFGA